MHSSTRVVIERAFALKGRFRLLEYLDMNIIDLIPQVLIAACVLHNICIVADGSTEDFLRDLTEQDVNGHRSIARGQRSCCR